MKRLKMVTVQQAIDEIRNATECVHGVSMESPCERCVAYNAELFGNTRPAGRATRAEPSARRAKPSRGASN